MSHGLEVTCADELGGAYRLQRGRWYYAALQAHFNRSVAAVDEGPQRVHSMREIPNVGHDHTQLWQSPEGLRALFDVGEA